VSELQQEVQKAANLFDDVGLCDVFAFFSVSKTPKVTREHWLETQTPLFYLFILFLFPPDADIIRVTSQHHHD
jgi:hypothetical protein